MLRKLIRLACTLGAAILLLSGCGSAGDLKVPGSAKDIMAYVLEQTGQMKNMVGSCNMVMDLGYDAVGTDGQVQMLSLQMTSDMAISCISDPMALHINMSQKIVTGDPESPEAEEEPALSYEIYGVTDEDSNMFTLYTGYQDQWYKEEVPLEQYEGVEQEMAIAADMADYEDIGYVLMDVQDKVNNRDVYVLEGKLTDELLEGALTSFQGVTELLGENLQIDDFAAPVTYKVYKDDLKPAQLIMDFTEVMQQLSETLDIEIYEVKMTYTFDEVNTELEINVPREAFSATDSITSLEN